MVGKVQGLGFFLGVPIRRIIVFWGSILCPLRATVNITQMGKKSYTGLYSSYIIRVI